MPRSQQCLCKRGSPCSKLACRRGDFAEVSSVHGIYLLRNSHLLDGVHLRCGGLPDLRQYGMTILDMESVSTIK